MQMTRASERSSRLGAGGRSNNADHAPVHVETDEVMQLGIGEQHDLGVAGVDLGEQMLSALEDEQRTQVDTTLDQTGHDSRGLPVEHAADPGAPFGLA